MKASDIREKTNEEINSAIRQCRGELFQLRLKIQTNQLDNPARIRLLRKDVARLETELTRRRKALLNIGEEKENVGK